MTFAKLSIDLEAWISIPDEACYLHKELAVSPELGGYLPLRV
jgi:hypothetical protein